MELSDWMSAEKLTSIVRAFAVVALGLLLSRGIKKRLRLPGLTDAQLSIARRFLGLAVLFVCFTWALAELGFKLSVLLSGAGILTVAVGFASQTAASNIVSGLFLVGDRSFSVSDVVQIGSTTGTVISVDLLSVRLRTFDNLLVRIPNEIFVKSELTNYSYHPIRRVDTVVSVAYGSQLGQVKLLLLDIAHKDPLCLEDPEPLIIFLRFGESGVDVQFSVWATKEHYLDVKNAVFAAILQRFFEAGIAIPLPQRVVHVQSAPAAKSLASDGVNTRTVA